MKCTNCGSNDVERDPSRGDTICKNCGKVLEENAVVFDVAFENTKVVGTFVSDGGMGGVSFAKNRHGNPMIDSGTIRLNKAYRTIQSIASRLGNYIFYIIKRNKSVFS